MSFNDRDPFLIREIQESIDLIFQFMGEMSEKEFSGDLKTQAAVAMMIQRIGEAGGKLSAATKLKSRIDWNLIGGLRNRISHAYGSIDHEIIWSIARNDLWTLRQKINQITSTKPKGRRN